MLYEDMYRCESCSAFPNPEPGGVTDFARRGPRQTIPVSHFGDISNAKIWLVLTNPANDRNDPNVGHLVSKYKRENRTKLEEQDTEGIFKHFSSYFNSNTRVHPFFNEFLNLLDGLVVQGNLCTFQNGGICAVDMIKCPTVDSWQKHVRTDEGKIVWKQMCLGQVNRPSRNNYITRQIDFHQPPVLIFAQSTQGLISADYRGNSNRRLNGTLTQQEREYVSDVYTRLNPNRISIALCGMTGLRTSITNVGAGNMRMTLQNMINHFF